MMKCVVLTIAAVVCCGVVHSEDEVSNPHPPLEAARTMKVPSGFQVTLFAGEPDVTQPIGFCIDDRGRLWVAEALNYPNHGTKAGDRIIILEDTDGDGHHDKRTVFYDKLNYVTGIEVGFGGVWVMSPPFFCFIPDRDGDDRPDSEPQVLLDGFGNHANAHNLANGFAWGPDGWLYGTHGRTNWSMIGRPDTPEDERIRFDGGVYRYHPVRHQWEPYADGTTNPWGIDWNDRGHAFVCNCVNPHLFQVIQGAHYEPWRGRESSQYAYQRLDTIADHLHFVGLSNVRHGLGSEAEDTAGGGHAHCGTMIYLGDSLPSKYRNTLFTNNIHGRRINNDILKQKGSGYVASHGADLMRSDDPWFMGVTLAYGPSGEIYASDWSDTGECHSIRNTRRHTGRIYRLTYKKHDLPPVALANRTNAELVELQMHENDWYVRHARRLLQERAAAGDDMSIVQASLLQLFVERDSVPQKLRAMWALKAIDRLAEPFLINALEHDSQDVRSWAVTLLCEGRSPSGDAMTKFVELATSGNSPLVRLSLASALQRLEFSQRWPLAEALASRGEDRDDQNLPLMIWYGIEPLVEEDLPKFANLAASAAIPRVRINAARRIASLSNPGSGLQILSQHLATSNDDVAGDLLSGILQGVEGRRSLPTPRAWHSTYQKLMESPLASLRDQAVRLAVVFNDQQALTRLQQTAANRHSSADDRRRAIDALVAKRVAGFDLVLLRMLEDASVRAVVLRGLAAYNSPNTASTILEHYGTMGTSDRQNALMTLASRVAWANALLIAVSEGRVPATDITAFAARQIRALGNARVTAQLEHLWGEIRETPEDRLKQIADTKDWLTIEVLAQANLGNGHEIFKKQCVNCHKFFGEGGNIGPDITGAQRNNLDYMLENIIAPSAVVARDYQMEFLQTDDGRIVTGLIESESDETIVIQTVNERLVIPKDEVEGRKTSNVSIMPTGLLEPLSDEDIRDLFGYLQRTE